MVYMNNNSSNSLVFGRWPQRIMDAKRNRIIVGEKPQPSDRVTQASAPTGLEVSSGCSSHCRGCFCHQTLEKPYTYLLDEPAPAIEPGYDKLSWQGLKADKLLSYSLQCQPFFLLWHHKVCAWLAI